MQSVPDYGGVDGGHDGAPRSLGPAQKGRPKGRHGIGGRAGLRDESDVLALAAVADEAEASEAGCHRPSRGFGNNLRPVGINVTI